MGNRSHTIYLGLQNNIVFVKIYGTESTLMEQAQHLRYTRTLNTNKDIWNKINT